MRTSSRSALAFAKGSNAFSLIEGLITVAILGIIATVAFQAYKGTTEGAQLTKLESDVSTVNQAIKVYLANGGDLMDCDTPQKVLDKLKTKRQGVDADQFAGLRDSMIDRRLAARLQTAAEAESGAKRAIWSPAESRFVIDSSGARGVREFYLDASLAQTDYGTEDREDSVIALNANDGWIWAYEDSSGTPPPGPTVIPLAAVSGGAGPISSSSGGSDSGDDGGDSGTDDSGPPAIVVPPDPDPVVLDPPVIEPAGGEYSSADFASGLTVTISNPNTSSTWVMASVNGSDFVQYSTPFDVGPGTTVEAYSDGDPYLWTKSSTVSATYTQAPSAPPIFAAFCGGPLSDAGVIVLDGGELKLSHDESGVLGSVAIGPDSSWNISNGAVTGAFEVHPGTSGDLGNGDTQPGNGGSPIIPVQRDLSALPQAAIDLSNQAAALDPTQTFGKIKSDTTISATAADGFNVIQISEIALSGGAVLTIDGGADDYFVINISKKAKMSGGSTWSIVGIEPSQILFNMLPGSSEFEGTGGSSVRSGGIILAPHSGAKVTLTGASVIEGVVIVGSGGYTGTGGSQVVASGCN